MRHIIRFSILALMSLCLFCLADTRADDVQLVPQESESDVTYEQAPADNAVAQEPAAPRFMLLLTRQVVTDSDRIVRNAPTKSYPDLDIEPFAEPVRQFSSFTPVPKRSSKRPASRSSKQETLRVLCADVKLSGSAATGKAVNYTIQCTGPVTLDNGTTTIHASKLHYAEGALTLDDVTIHQTGSKAGLLEELQAKQLTIKFPLESVTVQDVSKYRTPKVHPDAIGEPSEFYDPAASY